jgi:2-C-methyl-D-erythritol 4-phosphate cytidylyltransferase
MKQNEKVFAVIPAGGMGLRMGKKIQKQFLSLGRKPILVHTILCFENCSAIDGIVIAVPEQSIGTVQQMIVRWNLKKVLGVVVGGEYRQDSVYNALMFLSLDSKDIVLIHDGVRPFIRQSKILEVIRAVRLHKAAVISVTPKDTLRMMKTNGFFAETLDRNKIQFIQTPQGFQASLITEAHRQAKKQGYYATDDAALLEKMGFPAYRIEGSYDNMKITTQGDLDIARLILKRWKP